ncbi:MAG: hypothetical protein EOO17_04660 [Chloroflexi bacterium]|nr:MAG: hypothetical protein EOO17_04660 [Chloroflexota bacterium]
MIDHNQKISPNELFGYIETVALTYGYTGKALETITEEAHIAIEGMRHELAFESVLYYIDGIDILETTPEDDLKGIDYRIQRDDGTIIEIDVKQNIKSRNRSIEKQRKYEAASGRYDPKTKLILWSGFDHSDFQNKSPWRPTQAAVARIAPSISELLHAIPRNN